MLSRRRNRKALIGAGASSATPVRYLRLIKQNNGAGGNYHKEVKIFVGGVEISLFAGNLSHQGLQGFSATHAVDGNLGSIAFWTDTTGIGDYLQIDLGAGNEVAIDEVRLYVDNNVTAQWGVFVGNDTSDLQRMTITEATPSDALVSNALDVNDTVTQWYIAKWDASEYTE